MSTDTTGGQRPSIFISCVSNELSSARKKVADILQSEGFDVVQQESFPTDAGNLKAILREKIDRCEGLIQLIGDAYGAEPLEPDAEFGRVSYTQYELRYARSQNKKVWMLFAGAESPRDTPIGALDLPKVGVANSENHQTERRALQQTYRKDLVGGDIRYTWHSEVELENLIYRMRGQFNALREEYIARQNKVDQSLSSISSRQQIIGLAVAALIAIVITGFIWTLGKTKNLIGDLPKIANLPKDFDELGAEDLFIRTNLMTSGLPGGNTYVVTVGPANEDLKFHFQDVSISFMADNKPIAQIKEAPTGVNIVDYRSYLFKATSPPATLSVSVTNTTGETIGPFTYDTDLKSQLDRRGELMEGLLQQSGLGDMLQKSRNTIQQYQLFTALQCEAYDEPQRLRACRLENGSDTTGNTLSVQHVELTSETRAKTWRITPGGRFRDPDVVLLPKPHGDTHSRFMIFADSKLSARLTFKTGDESKLFESGSGKANRWGKESYELRSKTPKAPRLFLVSRSFDYHTGGRWNLIPMIGDDIETASWTTFAGGENVLERDDNAVFFGEYKGEKLGVKEFLDGQRAPNIILTLKKKSSGSKSYVYAANWEDWGRETYLSTFDFEKAIHCVPDAFGSSNSKGAVKVACYSKQPLGRLFADLHWGTSPDVLKSLKDRPTNEQLIEHYKKRQTSAVEQAVSEGVSELNIPGMERANRYGMEYFVKSVNAQLPPLDNGDTGLKAGTLLMLSDKAQYMYFRFIAKDKHPTRTFRVKVASRYY